MMHFFTFDWSIREIEGVREPGAYPLPYKGRIVECSRNSES